MKAAILPPGIEQCERCGIQFAQELAWRHTWLRGKYCSKHCVTGDARDRDALPISTDEAMEA